MLVKVWLKGNLLLSDISFAIRNDRYGKCYMIELLSRTGRNRMVTEELKRNRYMTKL